jgi:hypothetical protein
MSADEVIHWRGITGRQEAREEGGITRGCMSVTRCRVSEVGGVSLKMACVVRLQLASSFFAYIRSKHECSKGEVLTMLVNDRRKMRNSPGAPSIAAKPGRGRGGRGDESMGAYLGQAEPGTSSCSGQPWGLVEAILVSTAQVEMMHPQPRTSGVRRAHPQCERRRMECVGSG